MASSESFSNKNLEPLRDLFASIPAAEHCLWMKMMRTMKKRTGQRQPEDLCCCCCKPVRLRRDSRTSPGEDKRVCPDFVQQPPTYAAAPYFMLLLSLSQKRSFSDPDQASAEELSLEESSFPLRYSGVSGRSDGTTLTAREGTKVWCVWCPFHDPAEMILLLLCQRSGDPQVTQQLCGSRLLQFSLASALA